MATMTSKNSTESTIAQKVIHPNPFPSKFIYDGTIMTGGLKKGESIVQNTDTK